MLDQFAHEKEGGVIRHAGGLLDAVRHDDDGILLLQLIEGFFHLGRGDGIQPRRRLVEQQYLRFQSQTAGDAQSLLLPAR